MGLARRLSCLLANMLCEPEQKGGNENEKIYFNAYNSRRYGRYDSNVLR